mmetsp:Transcript_7848/g.28688  ORF Transcript_7848/g.28688 Transcript_7848/m.28688 type:complete len:255 (+) Transcript_7848:1780-2544(+)
MPRRRARERSDGRRGQPRQGREDAAHELRERGHARDFVRVDAAARPTRDSPRRRRGVEVGRCTRGGHLGRSRGGGVPQRRGRVSPRGRAEDRSRRARERGAQRVVRKRRRERSRRRRRWRRRSRGRRSTSSSAPGEGTCRTSCARRTDRATSCSWSGGRIETRRSGAYDESRRRRKTRDRTPPPPSSASASRWTSRIWTWPASGSWTGGTSCARGSTCAAARRTWRCGASSEDARRATEAEAEAGTEEDLEELK